MTTKKNSIFRKCIILTLILSTVLSFSLSSSAALPEDNTIEPLWYNMSIINLYFIFSDETSMACSEIGSKASTTLIEATLTVYRKEGFRWVTVASNTASSTISLGIDTEFNAMAGATYKAVLDVTAYGTSATDTQTLTEIDTND